MYTFITYFANGPLKQMPHLHKLPGCSDTSFSESDSSPDGRNPER